MADISFLVTASHVATLMTVDGHQLYIADTSSNEYAIPLEGTIHLESNLDVSVFELRPDHVRQLPNRTFLTVQHTDRADKRKSAGGFYLVQGYPTCWSEYAPESQLAMVRPFTAEATLYTGATDTFLNYDPEMHILLELAKEERPGTSSAAPQELGGISGSSLWHVSYEGLPTDCWDIDDAMIVAVQTGTHKKGSIIRGTRWCVAHSIIAQQYPELKEPLSLVTPNKRMAKL